MTRTISRLLLAVPLAGLVLLPAAAAHHVQAPANTLTAEDRKLGFTLLFDGKTIDQWRGFRQKTVPNAWKVSDGNLTRVADGPDLISIEQYDSFDFRFDWQVAPGANSGVMFHVTETEAETYHTGPEYQILDNARHADGKNPLTSAAACYAILAPPKDFTRPVGDWNEGRIVVNGNHVEHFLNGERVVVYDIGSPAWNRLVARSKFNEVPTFGKPTRGHLALQQHGGAVGFRNLKVRSLK